MSGKIRRLINTLINKFYTQKTDWVLEKAQLKKPLKSLYRKFEMMGVEPLEYSHDGLVKTFNAGSHRDFETMSNTIKEERPVIDDLVDELDKDMTFFDIGSHIGIYSIISSKFADPDNIYAFEPDKQRMNRLEENIEINNIDVQTYLVALSSIDSVGKFSRSRLLEETKSGSISIIRGDNFFEHDKFHSPDVMKIDVGGLEYEIIDGFEDTLQNKQDCVIYIEVHLRDDNKPSIYDYGRSPEELHSLLSSVGFNIKKIQERERDYHIKAKK